eukprot:366237-Chlamydomonas_euryale.AAC.1
MALFAMIVIWRQKIRRYCVRKSQCGSNRKREYVCSSVRLHAILSKANCPRACHPVQGRLPKCMLRQVEILTAMATPPGLECDITMSSWT